MRANATDPQALLDWLIPRFPGFSASWAVSLHNHGDVTFHGICAEFGTYYIHGVEDYGAPEAVALFRMIENVVATDRVGFHPLSNALCTCFLENIACTRAGEASVPLMGPQSYAFFEGWHRPPPYER